MHEPDRFDTVGQLLDWAGLELERAGIVCGQGTSSCRDEAAALIWHRLGLDHADDSAYRRPLTPADEAACQALIRLRIAERLPAAYLVGEAWFAGLPFHVDGSVLIPRSPFAELIETAFQPWFNLPAEPRILEVGTGSGCIAIACARAFPLSRIVATDVSAAALDVARRNAERHGVAARVELRLADLYAGIDGPFDAILSNPPYVPDGELVDMPPEFAAEPRAALAGGGDGLDLVRWLVADARPLLKPGGFLAIEVGAGSAALEAAFPAVPFLWPDFARGGDGIALVAARDLPGDNTPRAHAARR